MSDKEESAPVAAPAASNSEVDAGKNENAPAASTAEAKAAAAPEKSEEAVKPTKPEPAKEEVAKPNEGKHSLQLHYHLTLFYYILHIFNAIRILTEAHRHRVF